MPIPSKTLRETVLNLSGWRERGFYGRAYRIKKDIQAKDLMMRLPHMTLDHEVDVLEHQFARNGVHTMTGMARFIDPHHVEVLSEGEGPRVFRGERFLLSVGTRPHRPADVPFDGRHVLDSDEIVEISHLPRSLAVIGAGVIGIEYATIFSALDVADDFGGRASGNLSRFHRPGIDRATSPISCATALHDGSGSAREVTAIEIENDRPVTVLESGRRIRSEMLLYAVGRMGATGPLNLGCCGLESDHRGRLRRSMRIRSRHRSRIFIPPAMRSVSQASPRPRWSKAASPPATRSA